MVPRGVHAHARVIAAAALLGAVKCEEVLGVSPVAVMQGMLNETKEDGGGEERYAFGTKEFYVSAGGALGCVCLAALAAGLTLSFGSIDALRLEVIVQASKYYHQHVDEVDDEAKAIMKESGYAQKLLPFIKGPLRKSNGTRGEQWWWSDHLLLVTLLVCNSAANECLPLFLDKIVPSWLAIILSVSFVLIFGEVIPSALFSNPNMKLPLATYMRPLLSVFIVLAYPIAWPIGKCLDSMLGHGEESFRKEELRALIMMHGNKTKSSSKWGGKVFLVPVPEDRALGLDEEEAFRAYGGRTPRVEDKSVKVAVPDEKTGLLGDDDAKNRQLSVPTNGNLSFSTSANGGHGEAITRSEAIFAMASAADLRQWLKTLGVQTEHEVELEPRSKERRGQGTDRAWINCKTEEDAEKICAAIAKVQDQCPERKFNGWIKVVPEVVDAEGARYTALDAHEVHMINAVLDLDMKTVGEECRTIADVFMLSSDAKIDRDTILTIKEKGFSRVPLCNQVRVTLRQDADRSSDGRVVWSHGVCLDKDLDICDVCDAAAAAVLKVKTQPRVVAVDGQAVVTLDDWAAAVSGKESVTIDVLERGVITGLLFTKSLIGEPTDGTRTLGSMATTGMVAVRPNMALDQLLDLFQQRGSHMAVVTNNPVALERNWESTDFTGTKAEAQKCFAYGVITLEDVLEEIVGDIEDEHDVNCKTARDKTAMLNAARATKTAPTRGKRQFAAKSLGSAKPFTLQSGGATKSHTPATYTKATRPGRVRAGSMFAASGSPALNNNASRKMGAAAHYQSAFGDEEGQAGSSQLPSFKLCADIGTTLASEE